MTWPHTMEQYSSDNKCVHVRISGLVQGVWFRHWTVEQARSLELRGWVRNRIDGTVEAVFSGLSQNVDRMLHECHQGPPNAKVTQVQSVDHTDPGMENFTEWPTC